MAIYQPHETTIYVLLSSLGPRSRIAHPGATLILPFSPASSGALAQRCQPAIVLPSRLPPAEPIWFPDKQTGSGRQKKRIVLQRQVSSPFANHYDEQQE
jgi:hypothetical protein